jgi:hypothetical protein
VAALPVLAASAELLVGPADVNFCILALESKQDIAMETKQELIVTAHTNHA